MDAMFCGRSPLPEKCMPTISIAAVSEVCVCFCQLDALKGTPQLVKRFKKISKNKKKIVSFSNPNLVLSAQAACVRTSSFANR